MPGLDRFCMAWYLDRVGYKTPTKVNLNLTHTTKATLGQGGYSIGGQMDNNPVINIIRAVPRPAISVIFAAVIAQAVIEGITPPTWFLTLAIPCIVWWFGERTVTHIKEKRDV